MRIQDQQDAERSLRPKGARLDPAVPAHVAQAAGTGRVDALDSTGLLDLQRTAGNAAVGSLLEEDRSPVHGVVSSGGEPLEPGVRTEMESRLGHDFGDVRVHADGAADQSAQSVNAHAYTVGSNVVFQRDKYDASSTEGKTMLAHELTHVVQQRSGPVDGSPAAGGIRVSDPSDRFERAATATAEAAMSAPPVAAPSPTTSPSAVVQRADAGEEDDVAQTYVQREEEPEEEAAG